MPNAIYVFLKRGRSLICTMSWDKTSSKKCMTKSWKPTSTLKMHKPFVTNV
jgi:hypothetical protein